MSRKRPLLELLTRDELVEVADRFEVTVADRRLKDNLVEALASSRRVALAEVLPQFQRDRLKELCRALGLDDAGREKAALIQRLLGTATDGTRQGGVAPPAPVQQLDLPVTGKLTVDQLQRYLWSAADILRGSIDSSDYKNFIFGLLFLKRLSDRFEEEAEKLIADGIGTDVAWNDPDEHQFFVPARARWSAIQKTATNIGEALNKACAALEEQNSSLEGVVAGIDYNDERKLGDAKNRDTVLARLVQHFSQISLRNDRMSEPDLLGRAYEYLIEKFADDAGKKGGEFYTPRKVVQLIVEVLAPKETMRICDPTAGSGGMLIECAHYIERHGGNPKNLTLHGQEKNLGTWAICKMNMLLHGLPDGRIEKGDTLRDPKLVHEGELILYDRVIANPPFSLDEWGREVAEHDGYGRFRFGIPPKNYGDLAFVQHMVATMNDAGQVAVVMPHGVLFRSGSEGAIREALVREGLLEAVIGLPENLFYGTGIPASVLVFSHDGQRRRSGILMIDGSKEFVPGKNQNRLSQENVARLASTYHRAEIVPGFSRVVPIHEIEKNQFNLSLSRYVTSVDERSNIDVAAALAKLRLLTDERQKAEDRMASLLRELGYEV